MKKRPEDQSVTVVGNADNIKFSRPMKRITVARLWDWHRQQTKKPEVRK
ncbi:MAG TPA: hypothetical protein PLU16_15950 [Gallionellaceae bacterium]|jgi:hypothetical protein|nr:hypothetical protein [Gallionellaceae bacterium]